MTAINADDVAQADEPVETTSVIWSRCASCGTQFPAALTRGRCTACAAGTYEGAALDPTPAWEERFYRLLRQDKYLLAVLLAVVLFQLIVLLIVLAAT